MDAKQLARNILNHLGGSDNIEEMIYCSNRLRFKLADPSKVKYEALNATEGVMEFITQNGMFQVIVSKDIEQVYHYLKKFYVLDSKGKSLRNRESNLFERACMCLSYIFMPIMPILLGAGLLKVVLSVLVSIDFIVKGGNVYGVIAGILEVIFRYFPLLIGLSAASYFRCNQWLALIITSVLLYSDAKEQFASIFAILLSVYLTAKVEYLVERILDYDVFLYFRPLVILMIMIPVTTFLIAPLGDYSSYIFALGILCISQFAGFLVPAIIGLLYPVLIFFGMQYGIMDIRSSLCGTFGMDSLIGPGLIAAYIAQGVASLIVAYFIREKKTRQLGILSGITSMGGVVEPGILGINLRLSKPLLAGMASGGIIGLLFGIVGVRAGSNGSTGILALFTGRRAAINMICLLVAIIFAGLVTYWVEFRKVKKQEQITYLLPIKDHHEQQSMPDITHFQKASGELIYAPVTGRLMPLAFVNDPVYAQETMGKGVAILPEQNEIIAPADGKVIVLFEKGNAIGIESENGAEIFIHIGINTSSIEEPCFESFVAVDDFVKKGDRLIRFDKERLKTLGYDTIIPVSICNCDEYVEVLSLIHQDIQAGMPMTKLVKSNY